MDIYELLNGLHGIDQEAERCRQAFIAYRASVGRQPSKEQELAAQALQEALQSVRWEIDGLITALINEPEYDGRD